jgi:hypothetical protein
MSSYRPVRPAVRELDGLELDTVAKETEEVFETGGMVFSDGHCLELIRDEGGHLSLLDSNRKRGAQQIKYHHRTYVPPVIYASLLEALTLPAGRAFASTTDIFTKIWPLFTEHGLLDQAAKKLTYWVFHTWFVDLFPLAPWLVLTGSRPEAHLVLQLLAALARHGLPLADITLSGLLSMPMHIQPTLLIGRLSPGMRKVLSTSTYPRAFFPIRHGLADLYCAKAVYAGTHFVDDAVDGVFRVHLAPFHGKLPVLSDLAQQNLAADFQPLLLDYRMRHVAEVRDSAFDAPALAAELRILARVLGSAIVDGPELRADLVNLLQQYQEEIAAGNAFNEESIAVEALLSHSHSNEPNQLVYVGQLTDTSNRLLKERGSREKLEPKALGWTIRSSLGLFPKRNAKGFAIKLTEDVRHRIHQLARDFQVLPPDEAQGNCTHCADILASGGKEGKLEHGAKTQDI